MGMISGETKCSASMAQMPSICLPSLKKKGQTAPSSATAHLFKLATPSLAHSAGLSPLPTHPSE
eukprot:scaffold182080_cov23-Tisochrysis_lutea.AAC.1